MNGGGTEKETAAEVKWGSESKRHPGGRGAHEQKPLEREQEKRGANRNSGRGKGWAKAEATKPTPKPTLGTSKTYKVWCILCII